MSRTLKLLASLFILFFISSCGAAAQSPYNFEEPAAIEESNPSPDFDNLPTRIYEYDACPNTWVNSSEPKFKGFVSGQELINTVKNIEMSSVDQTWIFSLKQIDINDREVYLTDWVVTQRIQTSDGSYLVQELNPEAWIVKAKELSKLAPDLVVKTTAKWTLNVEWANSFRWELEYLSCSEK